MEDRKGICRGQIVRVDFGTGVGCEQHGIRPALVVQNDKGNMYSPCVIVVPVTSSRKKKPLPAHVLIKGEGLRFSSLALCEQIRTVDKQRVYGCFGFVDESDMKKVDTALLCSLGIERK